MVSNKQGKHYIADIRAWKKELNRCKLINDSVKRIGVAFADYAGEELTAWPGPKELATDLAIAPRDAQRRRDALEALGWLTWTDEYKDRAKVRKLTYPEWCPCGQHSRQMTGSRDRVEAALRMPDLIRGKVFNNKFLILTYGSEHRSPTGLEEDHLRVQEQAIYGSRNTPPTGPTPLVTRNDTSKESFKESYYKESLVDDLVQDEPRGKKEIQVNCFFCNVKTAHSKDDCTNGVGYNLHEEEPSCGFCEQGIPHHRGPNCVLQVSQVDLDKCAMKGCSSDIDYGRHCSLHATREELANV